MDPDLSPITTNSTQSTTPVIQANIPKAELGAFLKTYSGTDTDNAKLMRMRYGHIIRYSPPLKKWFIWDSKRWKLDNMDRITYIAKKIPQFLLDHAKSCKGKRREVFASLARSLESRTKLENMMSLFRSEPGIPVPADILDMNPWLINCNNGTLDLLTGNLLPHNPADLNTKIISANYLQNAECPGWMSFLKRITNNNIELMSYLQKATGYALTGITSERVIFILHGSGKNGKSSFCAVIRHLLGDYAKNISSHTLSAKNNSTIRNDIARLANVRFVSASETEESHKFAESLVKQFVGGADTLTARFLYQEDFEFSPAFKIFLSTNHRPTISGSDKAIWDRIRLIPFSVRIEDSEIVPDIHQRLIRSELDGIFRWAVDGCHLWQKQGLIIPEIVNSANLQYRSDMDRVGQFINDCCKTSSDSMETSANLYDAYSRWCTTENERPLNRQNFASRLEEHNFKPHRSTGGVHTWLGLKLLVQKSAE